jgi:hypothetical protein
MLRLLLLKLFGIEEPPCQSCETLKLQLSIANHEKAEMLNTILSFTKKEENTVSVAPPNYEELKPKMMTWNVRRQMLEAEDKKTAQLLAEQKRKSVSEQITELEKEVGIEEGVKPNA